MSCFLISCEAPSFAGVAERPLRRDSEQVVNETELGLPGELNELFLPIGHAFSEICGVDPILLNYLARLQLDLPKCRLSMEPGALEQEAVSIDQP